MCAVHVHRHSPRLQTGHGYTVAVASRETANFTYIPCGRSEQTLNMDSYELILDFQLQGAECLSAFLPPSLAFAQHFEGLHPLIYLNVSVIGSFAL